MAEILSLVQDRENSEFYPTPALLVRKMLEKVDWNRVETILEPSAGKGDILREIARNPKFDKRNIDIDAIELDPNLRSILRYNFSEEAEDSLKAEKSKVAGGRNINQNWQTKKYYYFDRDKREDVYFPEREQEQLKSLDYQLEGFFRDGIHIVHDDFLTYTNYKQYNLIVMNPPFSEGDKHLLKALKMQHGGGQIVCLLNAETIRNPYTAMRKHLVSELDKYDADIEYISNAFDDAERRADVDVALVYVNIPYNDEGESIFDRLAKSEQYEEPVFDECTQLEVTDFIQAIINRYRIEIQSGLKLIKEYRKMMPHLWNCINPDSRHTYDRPIIALTDGDNHEMTVNRYVRSVRKKYWTALLTNEKFIGRLTGKLQQEYREKVNSFAQYDFSMFNITTLLAEINSQIKCGIEEEITKMYDRLTEEHAYYPECQKNRHLYDGWKTNKAWKIDKKSILPCYGVFSSYDNKPRTYEAMTVLSDIERILNFFDGNITADIDLGNQLEYNFRNDNVKNIQCKFFNVTFYKKGTVHITFTCPELIDRFNIYAAQNRKWLPPSYGKKSYDAMTAEEQAVIDSFHKETLSAKEQKKYNNMSAEEQAAFDKKNAKQAYSKVMSRPDYYLASPVKANSMLLLDVGTEQEERTA